MLDSTGQYAVGVGRSRKALTLLALASDLAPLDRRQVRLACAFGCIRCGATIYQYRTMSDMDAGGAANAGLLCPPCNHALSAQPGAERALSIMRASPLASQKLFDRRQLPYSDALPEVHLPLGVVMLDTVVPVMFDNVPILQLMRAETHGAAIQIGVSLGSRDGEPVRLVDANEWVAPSGAWRFERPWNRYVFSSSDKSAELILRITAPNVFSLEKLRTYSGNHMLEIDERGVKLDGEVQAVSSVRSALIGISL